MPTLDYEIKNNDFFKHLGWNKSPGIDLVLQQLRICSQTEILDVFDICKSIYKHMQMIVNSHEHETESLRRYTQHEKWILVNGKFYSSGNVVFDLPRDFGNENTLIVGLPNEYKVNYGKLFEKMGVRLKIGIQDYVDIIKMYVKDDPNVELPADEISKVIELIDQVSREIVGEESPMDLLHGLLVPTARGVLVSLGEIQYDNMGSRLSDEEKDGYSIAHPSISLSMAKSIGMQMLSGKFIEEVNDDFMPEFYEQNESLTTRIRSIINDYLPGSVFKEFLQNADDAGARIFRVYIDERNFSKNCSNQPSSLLTEEMRFWQGPAVWIYNDAEFSDKDFKSLLRLGVADKLPDTTKIGRFGIGFNSVFNLTDIPSFVSGEYIAFLDPHAKHLPELGSPRRRPLGNRYNFVKTNFSERWHDQAAPYISMEGCDLKSKYNGTLFRIPLRNHKTAEMSEISDKLLKPSDLLDLFRDIQGNREMLFLRNVEECGVYYIRNLNPDLIWKAKIDNMSEDVRRRRQLLTQEAKIFQLEIGMQRGEHRSLEHWLLCCVQNEKAKEDLKSFSHEKKVVPRGGVAAMVSWPGENEKNYLRGEMYSYVSLSISNNLSVMLNGDFLLSSDRRSILVTENESLEDKSREIKWNRYILSDILPPLHAMLLNEIAIRDSKRLQDMRRRNNPGEKFTPHITTRDWPIVVRPGFITSGIYRKFGLTVLQRVIQSNYPIFWTEANGGEFISFREAIFAESEKESIISSVLVHKNVRIVKLSGEQYKHIKELSKSKKEPRYQNFITPELVCKTLENNKDIWTTYKAPDGKRTIKEVIICLLKFVLENAEQQQDAKNYKRLLGLPLVPLYDETVGVFGEKEYYIAKKEIRKLFRKTGSSHFVRKSELPIDFAKKEISDLLKVSELDTRSILKLLDLELPREEKMEWNPSGPSFPDKKWIEEILAKFSEFSEFDFQKFNKFPLLPMIFPREMLVRFDQSKPLLLRGNFDNSMVRVLCKLGVRFTDLTLPSIAHPALKGCIIQPTEVNVFKSIERAKSVERIKSLTPIEILKLRSFVNDFLSRTERNDQILKIIRNFPIWPVHFSEGFFAADQGYLLEQGFPIYSIQDVKIFRTDWEADYNSLFSLRANELGAMEYIHRYYATNSYRTDTNYVEFLKDLLLKKNSNIENYLSLIEVIPNKNSTEFVKANTLYDANVPLFRDIFDDDKFLPIEFQNNSNVLNALGRIGLKRRVDSRTFIDCAREIERKARESPDGVIEVIKRLGRTLMVELFTNYEALSFNPLQWRVLTSIKFVPTDANLSGLFEIHTDAISSLDSVCLFKYKDLIWTQVPLLDRILDPPRRLLIARPNLCEPRLDDIINHWYEVALEISPQKSVKWRSNDGQRQFREMMKEIYEYLNSQICNANEAYIGSRIRTDAKLFLNDDNPFEPESWVAGINLVYGVSEDVGGGQRKVSPFLEKYKSLLKLAGAGELKDVHNDVVVRKHDQIIYLSDQLRELLKGQENTLHHDVEFRFSNRGDDKRVYANRYVLSAACEHFRTEFSGYMRESIEGQRVSVEIEDSNPAAFQALVYWLYGQSFEKASEALPQDPSDYLNSLIDLLNVSNLYRIDPLKDILEKTIANKCDVNNVIEILKWAELYNAGQLKSHCRKYIIENER
ncbi:6879_t:CDS:2, partial [Acaulospora colombiana]